MKFYAGYFSLALLFSFVVSVTTADEVVIPKCTKMCQDRTFFYDFTLMQTTGHFPEECAHCVQGGCRFYDHNPEPVTCKESTKSETVIVKYYMKGSPRCPQPMGHDRVEGNLVPEPPFQIGMFVRKHCQ